MTYRSCTNTSAITRTPRIRSLAIMVRFKCHRSTKTPASGLTMASGAINDTSTSATWVAVPCRLNVTTPRRQERPRGRQVCFGTCLHGQGQNQA